MTRKDIELLLRVDIPDDGAPFVIEFVNQLMAEHGEQWIGENRDLVRARLETMGIITRERAADCIWN